MSNTWRNSLDSLSYFINYWKSNFASAYELNRVFFIGGENQCLADFTIGNNNPVERERMVARTRRTTVPQIFIGEVHVGGYDDMMALHRAGKLDPLLAGGGA